MHDADIATDGSNCPEITDSWEVTDRWLAQVKAEAWIEGYYACHQDYQRKSGPMLTPNPYREEADQ